jgi:hypothetical protein
MRLLLTRLLMATTRAVEAFDESLFLLDIEVSSGLTKTHHIGVLGVI